MYSIKELSDLFAAEMEKELCRMEVLSPANLYKPVNYALEAGGKRIRPLMALLAYNLFSETVNEVLSAAMAIEVFHNFTLLHDDIMDNADKRRNRPTVHKQFSENAAILSGDAMAFVAFQYLLKCNAGRQVEMAKLLADTAVGVCEGQQYDMDFETRSDVAENEYLQMIRLKTAILIACSFKMGALAGNAPEETATLLYDFGLNTGMAFQLQDDLLDTFGDEGKFGKAIGNDIVSNKKTYLMVKALEVAGNPEKEELLAWIGKTDFDRVEKINAVKSILEKLRIREITLERIESFYHAALVCLGKIPAGEHKKTEIAKLLQSMVKREH